MASRVAYSFTDRKLDRTAAGEAGDAVLVVDGTVYPAASDEGAWRQLRALSRWLADHLQPSARWQVCHLFNAHAEAAESLDRRSRVDPRSITSPTDMLNLVREVLGEDAYARVRQAAADRMLGRR